MSYFLLVFSCFAYLIFICLAAFIISSTQKDLVIISGFLIFSAQGFVSVLPFNHRFHGKVAFLLFLFLCLWQISRLMVDFYLCRDRRQVHDVRFFLALLSCIFLVGILCFFPYAINHQSMKTSSFLDQVHLLSFHPDWQTAALFEWALFFNTGGFFLTFIDDLSGSKSRAFRQ